MELKPPNLKIQLSASKYIIGKLEKVRDTDESSVKIEKLKRWKEFTISFENKEFTPEELCQHICSGWAISAKLKSPRRDSKNFESSQLLGLDIDSGGDEARLENLAKDPFIAENALIIHTTSSHTPEKPRARVLFLLPEPETSTKKFVNLQRHLIAKYDGAADSQCNDPARLWFGAKDCTYVLVGKMLDITQLVPEEPKKKAKKDEVDQDSRWVKFGEPIPEGTRNDHAYHYAVTFLRKGFTTEEVFNRLKGNWEKLGYSVPEEELKYTIAQAAKRVEENKQRVASEILKNDDDNAQRLLREYGEDIIYVAGMGWYAWNGKAWQFDNENAKLRVMAARTMRKVHEEALDDFRAAKEDEDSKFQKIALDKISWAINSLNVGRLNAMIDQASKYPLIRRDLSEIDPPEATKFLLNFQNGTLDLQTGQLRPHSKADMISKIIPHDFVPGAPHPTWDSTLELALGNDESLIEFIKRALGYSLSGSVREKCFFICHGEQGNNAKSTIFEAVKFALGPSYSLMSSIDVITNRDNSNYALASMAQWAGIRIVHMNEAEQTQLFSEALVKQLTGGDEIQAKKMRMDPIQFSPVFKLWIRANGLPRVRGTDNAIWSRIYLIPFTTIPAEKIRSRDEIDTLLHGEVEGILSWMVEGYMAWVESGLMAPDKVKAATQEYRSENDIIQQFMDEDLDLSDNFAKASTGDLYQAFNAYLKRVGLGRITITQQMFIKRLVSISGCETILSHGKRFIRGIKLTEMDGFGL